MTLYVDPSNAETAKSWDGPTGDLWTDNADIYDARVVRYLAPFLAEAAITPHAHVLDVGCGSGETTIQAARIAAAGSVTGIDLSTRQLDLARRRAEKEGLANVRFEQADAQVADLGAARYDRVISRTGVMFFGDPVAAFTNLARALKPEGRMVLLVWQPTGENEWFGAFRTAVAAGRDLPLPPADAPGPFSLADPDRLRAVLTAAGFAEPRLTGLWEPLFYGPDAATAVEMALGVVGSLLDDLDETARQGAVAALRATMEEHLGPGGVTFRSAMWLVTAGLPDAR